MTIKLNYHAIHNGKGTPWFDIFGFHVLNCRGVPPFLTNILNTDETLIYPSVQQSTGRVNNEENCGYSGSYGSIQFVNGNSQDDEDKDGRWNRNHLGCVLKGIRNNLRQIVGTGSGKIQQIVDKSRGDFQPVIETGSHTLITFSVCGKPFHQKMEESR